MTKKREDYAAPQGDPMGLFRRMKGKTAEEAKFYWWGDEALEIGEGVWHISRFSGVTAFETGEGLVLVDTGLERLSGGMAGLLRDKTSAPVHTAILTQGHVDHAYGLEAWLEEGQGSPEVVAHEAMPARFARYRLTAGMNASLNARQFRGDPAGPEINPGDFESFRRGEPKRPPTRLYRERLDLKVGGKDFMVRHCRGETDDHSWIWQPQSGVLCPGDLFIWCVPNAGNPQKVQRYVKTWAEGLREMALLGARTLAPGHGGAIVDDEKKVKRVLEDTASYLEELHDATVAMLNEGAPPHVDIALELGDKTSSAPWLQPWYDDPEFIVRNVIREYGGWWSGRPSELKPPSRVSAAREAANLAGGAEVLLKRAEELMETDPRLSIHLTDYAVEAVCEEGEDADEGFLERAAMLYERRARGEPSMMGRNIYRSAASYARSGRSFK